MNTFLKHFYHETTYSPTGEAVAGSDDGNRPDDNANAPVGDGRAALSLLTLGCFPCRQGRA